MQNAFSSKLYTVIRTLVIIAVIVEMIAILIPLGIYLQLDPKSFCDDKEISRLASPNKVTDAVWIERYCSSVGFNYKLYFVPTNGPVSESVPAIVMDSIEDIDLGWISTDEFRMTYEIKGYSINSEKKNLKNNLIIKKLTRNTRGKRNTAPFRDE